MKELIITASQVPGVVTFDNYDEVKSMLTDYINEKYAITNYTMDDLAVAEADAAELKKLRKIVSDKKKELEKAYSAPYVVVEEMLDELIEIIDEPYKRAANFVKDAEREIKQRDIMAYAAKKAQEYGTVGSKTIESPAFFKNEWLLAKYKVKNYQDEIDEILSQAATAIKDIQTAGGDDAQMLAATYYETLSMDRVKSFQAAMKKESGLEEDINVESEHNAKGYKILKIIATEDQMASILDLLDIMEVEVDVLEDGMPQPMEELTIPEFDSFVAFDIETTGTNGAASGDGEAKITEIGAVRVVNGEVVGTFDELANPGRKIVPRIAQLTHITDEMVADKPPVDDVIKAFHEFAGDSILVGHNIKSSDLRYITKAAAKAGVHFGMPFLDTYILAKQFKENMGWENVKLSTLSSYYGVEHKEVHRAWSDAEVNVHIYFELKKLSEAGL